MYHPDYFENLGLHATKTNHLGSPKISLEAPQIKHPLKYLYRSYYAIKVDYKILDYNVYS